MSEAAYLVNLVVDYQRGDETVVDDIFNEIQPLIEKASEEITWCMKDPTKFDCRIVIKLKKLLTTLNRNEDSFLGIAKDLIRREKWDFISRRADIVDEFSLEEMQKEGDGSEGLGYQFKDPLARVEEDVIHKERVSLLSQGNPKKEFILNQWSKGANDMSISEALSGLFGGNSESHRKFITRFKTGCRKTLTDESASMA